MTVDNVPLKRNLRLQTTTSWLFSGPSVKHEQLLASIENAGSASSASHAVTVTLDRLLPTASTLTEQVEEYEILESLGEGAVCDVYAARSKALDKVFALKILKRDLVNNKSAVKQFEKEVRAALELSHTNIALVYGFGKTANGLPFLVQELCQGKNLAKIVREEGKLEPDRALKLFMQISDAMAHAHARAVIHRDLKPNNIMLTSASPDTEGHSTAVDEFVRVIDFGMSSVLQSARTSVTDVTRTGEVFGTPSYMSPEQCLGDKADERSDVYSFGCLMYETVTGRPPFIGINPVQVILKQLKEPPPKLIDEWSNKSEQLEKIERVILKCLEKDPVRRYKNFDLLKNDLEACLLGQPITARGITTAISAKKRLAAAAIDGLAVTIATGTCSALVGGLLPTTDEYLQFILHAATQIIYAAFWFVPEFQITLWAGSLHAHWVPLSILLYPLLACIYHVLLESSPLQATPGKKLAGLKVVDMEGHTISKKQALLRFWSKTLAPAMVAIESNAFRKDRKISAFPAAIAERIKDLPTDRLLGLQVIDSQCANAIHPLRGKLFPNTVEEAFSIVKRLRVLAVCGLISFGVGVTALSTHMLPNEDFASVLASSGLAYFLISITYLSCMVVHQRRLLRSRQLSKELLLNSWTGIFMSQLNGGVSEDGGDGRDSGQRDQIDEAQ